ncbi:PhoD-like phosphatase-domain-containing protein [Lipomyces tetrasporus]|uniref:PhoD-like phosphatase-domain-containing protein n=1 Tax=Lipomyces tetrasporus TaxID=54092 RepID=A0AAD7VPW4_9ASCO|nr:PhoD-like phosphatase-domain-containing protein [Lipomyces tetrasporus]KAJ8097256.1 PhoD-like phosphatase-domain-containing protein [Lipomyces tetrasporus]
MDFAVTWPASVLAISSLTLRIVAPYFVQWLPLGPRFTPLIYTSSVLYFTTFAYELWRHQHKYRHKHREQRDSKSLSFWIVNLLCLLATVDFVYRNHVFYDGNELSFSRVGYVESSSARVVIRVPSTSTVQIEYRQDNIAQWTPGQVLSSHCGNHDNVLTFTLTSLQENASHVYRTNASHIGSFRTSQRNPKRWTLVTTSCIKPFYPYNPFGHSLRIRGLEYLSRFVTSRNVEFVLFLGDFIYIDLPHRFGWTTGDYYKAYRQVYSSPSWSSQLFALPWLHIYDDHEITNDWSGNETGLYQYAIKPYLDYQQLLIHRLWGKGQLTTRSCEATCLSLSPIRGGIDLRLLWMTDLAKLCLARHKDGISSRGWKRRMARKVIVSGVPFTRNWRGQEANDSWAGYLWERQLLLEKMWKTDGVVILSGDRHEHAATLFPSPDGTSKVIEFSTSPLSQFYQPFERQVSAN